MGIRVRKADAGQFLYPHFRPQARGLAWLVWNHLSTWALDPQTPLCMFSVLLGTQPPEVFVHAWLTCTECLMLPNMIFVACVSSTQTDKHKRGEYTNLTSIPSCPTWLTSGSTPSLNQHCLISEVSIVWESDCFFNTSLKPMPVF